MASSREQAFRLLSRWHVLQDPPQLPERTLVAGEDPWAGLTPRDRSFAFDMVTGVIRWRNLLDEIIASRLKQTLESVDHPVRVLLWIGTYQLLLQEGTANYAAVDTTVDLAKKMKSTRAAAGLVNAVLRGITRLKPTRVEGKLSSRRAFATGSANSVQLSEDIFADPVTTPTAHLSVVRSHPSAYVNYLRKHYGDEVTSDILLANNRRPVVTLRADKDTLDISSLAGLVAHTTAKHFLVAKEGWNPIVEKLVQEGTLSPQDPTSAKPVLTIAEQAAKAGVKIKRVLDLCAGLGTKSIQLARVFPEAQIIASDVDSLKLVRLAARAKAAKITNITTVVATELADHILAAGGEAGGKFDAVLVDVPCSNTGVFAKRVQSRWRWASLDHEELHTLQKNLLIQGGAYLNLGGLLVYSTCSIDPEENEKLVRALLKDFPQGLKIAKHDFTLPATSDDPAATHDGGFFALLS